MSLAVSSRSVLGFPLVNVDAQTSSDHVSVDEIRVGRRNRRSDDVELLAYSISQVGQTDPVLITADGNLVSGYRRLRACEQLGRPVKVRVIGSFDEVEELLDAEGDVAREPMKGPEVVSLLRVIEALWDTSKPKGSRRDRIGLVMGMSHQKINELTTIVDAAERGEPRGREALDALDSGKPVHTAFKILTAVPVKEPREGKPFPVHTKRQRQMAARAKERLWKVVNGVSAYDEFLGDFDIGRALAVLTDEEKKEMSRMISSGQKALRELRRTLNEKGSE